MASLTGVSRKRSIDPVTAIKLAVAATLIGSGLVGPALWVVL